MDETVSTLKFADRAKQVMTSSRINLAANDEKCLISKLQNEVHSSDLGCLCYVDLIVARNDSKDVTRQWCHAPAKGDYHAERRE